MQIGLAAALELHGFIGLQFENRPAVVRLGNRKILSALLDLNAEFVRDLGECILHTVPAMKVHRQNNQTHCDRRYREPTPQMRYK